MYRQKHYFLGNITIFGVFLPVLWMMFYVYTVSSTSGCNEAVCASIVSKCMLTQSCKCDAKNISCSKDCFYCLDYLYSECCSCIDMCPKSKDTENDLSHKSQVEDLAEPFPDLFSVLTEEKDRLMRWTSHTYPAQVSFVSVDKEVKFVSTKPEDPLATEMVVPVNCTVAYMSQCMSYNKCKSACSSMGASSYRWFHTGCCECVGSTCLNYGINESKCLDCPLEKEEQQLIEEQNVISKESEESEKVEDELSKEKEEVSTDSLVEKKEEEVVDKMQDIDS